MTQGFPCGEFWTSTCSEADVRRFTDKERDAESGLDYFRARHYASPHGRFTSVDPALASGQPGDPQTWNRHAYVGNDAAKGTKELTKSAEKGIRSLEKRIAEHHEKLADFKANPTVRLGMEGQPESVIKAAQESRIRHLEKEIQTFKENIEKLKGGQ